MSEQSDFSEKRQHKRLKAPNSVTAKINDEEIEVTLLDLSAGGAALDLAKDVKPDDPIELMIDDVGELSATVSRSLDDGVAVRFLDIDDDEEEMLLADLERIDIDIRTEDF
ncbi:MAG: PilZ domain-containing protein [Rhodospirillaceae bacterium]|jgi:c-di-GMP-binding flagellar brake protein YcgR|nr:PilZ domain-containing protein [Rhodospirillaceae bacterium]MBT7265565.1 PilZ domain-containing protein [Rhodospirillaceae bacterium]